VEGPLSSKNTRGVKICQEKHPARVIGGKTQKPFASERSAAVYEGKTAEEAKEKGVRNQRLPFFACWDNKDKKNLKKKGRERTFPNTP